MTDKTQNLPVGPKSGPLFKRLRWFVSALLIGIIAIGAMSWQVAGQLVAPQPAAMPTLPADFPARAVTLPLAGGGFVKGWWLSGPANAPSVLLLHGVRANRLAMLGRARLLVEHGYSVLLIDLPAHGESPGTAITLGLNESRGVVAARDWLRAQRPDARLGVIGVSLGGASVLLGPQPCGFDAVVLEAAYPDVHHAIVDRLRIRIGPLAPLAAPLLEWQLRPRLGIAPSQLRSIDHIADLGAPLLIVAGARDRHTRLEEARAMFDRAREPKALWVLPDASHQDFQARDPTGYKARVLPFLDEHLLMRMASTSTAGPWKRRPPEVSGHSRRNRSRNATAPRSIRANTASKSCSPPV